MSTPAMTAPVADVDGCATCGDRSAVSAEHRTVCAARAAARAEVEGLASIGARPVALLDLWAHLTTPRAGGPYCSPLVGVEVVRLVVDLGWRPLVGPGAPPWVDR